MTNRSARAGSSAPTPGLVGGGEMSGLDGLLRIECRGRLHLALVHETGETGDRGALSRREIIHARKAHEVGRPRLAA
ncbi:hypothetical protein GCM10010349_78030 [Streptomyces flavofungini]|nr:hypothetical protein GCM10010349_78030 [Streptomyces flavofungini]